MALAEQTADAIRGNPAKSRPASFDWWLLFAVGALVAFGLMMVYSTTFDWSYRVYGSPTTIFMRQVTSLALGLLALAAFARIDYHRWQHPFMAIAVLGAAVLALIAVLIVGTTVFGAQRGFFNGRVQPSEAAKLATIIYLSVWLASKRDDLSIFGYGMLPYGVIVGGVAGLIIGQPDLSAALTIVLVGATLFVLAGADVLQVGVAGVVSLVAGFLVVKLNPTGQGRLADYIAGLNDLTQASWHVQQAIVAFVKGSWFGRGLGESYQKFNILPTPHTDSIFAIVAEELGLAGCLLLIALFVILIWRGIKIAANAPDFYGALLAGGITCWLAYEAIINIAVMVAALPFAGNALPLISYGGSSLVVTLSGIGLLLSISRHDPEARPERKTRAAVDLRSPVERRGRSPVERRGRRNSKVVRRRATRRR